MLIHGDDIVDEVVRLARREGIGAHFWHSEAVGKRAAPHINASWTPRAQRGAPRRAILRLDADDLH